MKDKNRTKEQLITELSQLQKKVARLKKKVDAAKNPEQTLHSKYGIITENSTWEATAADKAVIDIAKGITATIGDEFFDSLCKHMSSILMADYAYIAELLPENPGRAKTLTLFANNRIIDNIEVDLSGTPCMKVLENNICACPSGVPETFPAAHVMASMNVEGYIGTVLTGSSGEKLGLMSVMYCQPVKNVSTVKSILQIYAARAAAELERRRHEKALQKTQNELETRVRERTADLVKANEKLLSEIRERERIEHELREADKMLKIHARELTESNSALKVLLKQREQDQKEFENHILSNMKYLVIPYIDKLKKNRLRAEELAYLNIIESNLKEIVSPFSTKLSFRYLDFTPKEIMIASLIKDGKQDKDIMEILNISLDTVKTHRKNIRRKLDIYGKRINLRSKLLSLD